MAIDSTATTLDALNHVTTNPAISKDAAQISQYNKKRHTLRAIVLSTVPSDILNLLSIRPDPSPKDLIDAVLNHLQTNTATDHKYLKSEAENLRLISGMTIDEYVLKHNSLRARMISSQFPNITDGTSTVAFMIESLRYSSDTIEMGRKLIAINPPTVKDFLHHSHRLKSYNITSPSIPTSTIYQTMPPPVNHLPSRQYLPRLPPRRPQYMPNRTPAYQPPGFRPCSFHQQFMRTPPNHSNEQCRDTRHPKLSRTGGPAKTESPNANHLTAFHDAHQIPYDDFNYQSYPAHGITKLGISRISAHSNPEQPK